MLVQFSIGNFLSFKNIVTLNMVASSRDEHENDNVFEINNKLRLLKSAVVYGANASGKSNLFSGMNFFKKFIFSSSKDLQATEPINVTNFKLSTENENKPSLFEIIFYNGGIRYRYGFQVDTKEVYQEWLFYVPKTKETKLFIREKDYFDIGTHFKEGKGLPEKTRKNSLFLSVVAQFNGEISTEIIKWFGNNFNIISGLDDRGYLDYTVSKLEDQNFKNQILEFIKIADLGIKDISIEYKKISQEQLPDEMPKSIKNNVLDKGVKKINTFHEKYDKNKKIISNEKFIMNREESKGTQKIFALSAPLIDTLRNGKVLIIDELDARLHPILIRFIIKLFNSKNINKSNAQLIFASHDTNCLNRQIFRRDQIWFTEKDQIGSTDLYSLIEYKLTKVRKDASFEKNYILGKYGAIPFIGQLDDLFR